MDGVYNVLSIHLVVEKGLTLVDFQEIKMKTKDQLERLGINHTTIEFETKDENCEPC